MSEIRDVQVERPSSGVAVVTFMGEHDLRTSHADSDLLRSLVEECELVVADLSKAEFIDSSMLHAISSAHAAAESRGRTLRLQLGTATIVERALEISGLLEHIDCASSREEALNGSGPGKGHRDSSEGSHAARA
jgi:anti-sigma B factor antagonist